MEKALKVEILVCWRKPLSRFLVLELAGLLFDSGVDPIANYMVVNFELHFLCVSVHEKFLLFKLFESFRIVFASLSYA